MMNATQPSSEMQRTSCLSQFWFSLWFLNWDIHIFSFISDCKSRSFPPVAVVMRSIFRGHRVELQLPAIEQTLTHMRWKALSPRKTSYGLQFVNMRAQHTDGDIYFGLHFFGMIHLLIIKCIPCSKNSRPSHLRLVAWIETFLDFWRPFLLLILWRYSHSGNNKVRSSWIGDTSWMPLTHQGRRCANSFLCISHQWSYPNKEKRACRGKHPAPPLGSEACDERGPRGEGALSSSCNAFDTWRSSRCGCFPLRWPAPAPMLFISKAIQKPMTESGSYSLLEKWNPASQ